MYHSIVILTGAGISADSGVPTFRDGAGMWNQHRLEEVASPEGFAANPALVHRFYNERRQALQQSIEPNSAHIALARLKKEYPINRPVRSLYFDRYFRSCLPGRRVGEAG